MVYILCKEKQIQDAALGSNIALVKWSHNLLRRKVDRTGIVLFPAGYMFACHPHGSLSALGDLCFRVPKYYCGSTGSFCYSCIWPSLLPNRLLTSKQAFSFCRNGTMESVGRLLPHWKPVTVKLKAFFRLLHQRLIAFLTPVFAYMQERQPLASHLPNQHVQAALQLSSTTQALLLSICFHFKNPSKLIWKGTVNINFLCTLGTSETSKLIFHVILCPCFSKQILFCCSRTMYITTGDKSLG